ncbi:MAG: cytochrome c oxidase subunit II [Alphaproteobacteria bacterium]|nr:cytochrome c oxidase subunit II [Alphaproteobacteria bacterium]
MASSRIFLRVLAALASLGFAGTAAAETATGQPVPWQMGLQAAASPVMEEINDFHNLLLVIITVIAIFVLGLMIYVMVKFNRKANPTPSTFTHNTVLEVVWTVIPVLILVVIAVPSFKLLYNEGVVPEHDMTIKVTGYSWFWGYEYLDENDETDFLFDAFMIDEENLGPGQPRLLATDNEIVVPVGKVVRVLLTSADVIHAWAVPALGVKRDAVPGRLNDAWFQVDRPGTYYGQCSELCGTNHAFMPIQVKAVSEADYEAWLQTARDEFARSEGDDMVRVADAR